jgi:prepilin-type N-terminal cleavage/methylation domain-containing protein
MMIDPVSGFAFQGAQASRLLGCASRATRAFRFIRAMTGQEARARCRDDRAPFFKRRTSRPRRGFSLVELLVAVAVLSTLMVLLFGFFDQATQAWQASERKIDAFREARAALYYIRRDLQSMVVNDHIPWVMYNDPQAISDAPPPNGFGPIRAGAPPVAHGDTLFFISRQPLDAQEANSLSDLCAVGYYLRYSPDLTVAEAGTGRIRSTYKLHRYFRSSNAAWEQTGSPAVGLKPFLKALSAQRASDTAASLPPTPAHTFLTNNQILFAAANPVSGDEVLARNVINLFIRAYTATHTQIATAGAVGEKPAYFEISLLALNNDTAAKLAQQADWHAPANVNDRSQLLRENAREFRIRVEVP